jgi:DNA-directed RNA polymerase specialized sigma24 family protein
VTDHMSALYDADDARLLNLVRAGDSDAFRVLQARHEAAARRLARHLVASPYEVDDVVGEAFAWVLEVTRRGGGPSNAVRPYVLTALRRVCYYRLTGQPTWDHADDHQLAEPGEPFIEPTMAGLETALIARAYLSLPERWRAVLWHAQVEQARPADVAPLLGLTRNGVAALNRRATDGLRQAYLQRHLSGTARPECRLVAERLGAYVHDQHAFSDAPMVAAHLDGCAECQAVYLELADVSGTLRAVVGPLVLGHAATAYLAGPGDNGLLAGAGSGRHAAQAAVDGGPAAVGALVAGGQSATTAVLRAFQRPWGRPRPAHGLAAVGVLAVVAVIALVVFMNGNGGSGVPTSARSPARTTVAATTPPASATQPTSPTAPPSTSPSPPPPTPSPTIIPAAAAAPLPSATLTASLDVTGGGMFGNVDQLAFQVTNTGSAATGTVTVSISLPAGSSMFSGGGGGGGSHHGGSLDSVSAAAWGHGGWDCQATSSGASCTHDPLQAGQQASGTLFVSLSGSSACGQPVSLTAAAGTATAQASQSLSC